MRTEQVTSIKGFISDLINDEIINLQAVPFGEGSERKISILIDKLQLNKGASSPLNKQTAISLFYSAVILFYLEKGLLPPFIDNRELSEDNKSELTNYLFSYFSTLPHKYNIAIPLHNLDIPNFKEEGSKFEVMDLGISVGIDNFTSSAKIGKYILLSSVGYFTRDNISHEIKPCLQDFNVVLYELLSSRVIRIKKNPLPHGINYEDTLPGRTKSIPILISKIENINYKSNINSYELPLQFSKFLDEIETAPEKKDLSIRKLRFVSKLINDESEAAKYIKAAMDWYINAQMVMDETMSFIQICMGLEALLGDKREGSIGLTQTLSDRCSYLIGKGMDDREEIKKQLKKAYELRSAIVHGLKNRINASEKEYVNNATLFLRRAIKVECQYLEYYNE